MIAAALLLLVGQSADDRLGLSEAQILRMGPDAFFKRYTAKNGESTAAMVSGISIYTSILERENNRRMTSSNRVFLTKTRTVFQSFANGAMGFGYKRTGGGTMWNVISASTYQRSELTIERLRRANYAGIPARKVSDGLKLLSDLEKNLRNAKSDDFLQPGDRKEAAENLAQARKAYTEIVNLARTQPRRASDTMLDFAVQTLESVKESVTF